jgi:hypothetical protein
MARFSHLWQSPLDLPRTWELIKNAFEDSHASTIWPNEMAEIRAQSNARLETDTPLTARYKLGPFKASAHYRIALYDPPRMIRYETTEKHPLKGYAVITMDTTTHGTRCRWKGEYRPKSPQSLLPLFWFKLYYERRFFKKLIGNFRALRNAGPKHPASGRPEPARDPSA